MININFNFGDISEKTMKDWKPRKIVTDERQVMELAAEVIQSKKCEDLVEEDPLLVPLFGVLVSMLVDNLLDNQEEEKDGGH